MKIKDLLELTQNEKIADIAKSHLTIGEKPARAALRAAGCYPISGKRGWFYEGDPVVLEQSIYEFLNSKSHGELKKITNKEPIFKSSNEQNMIIRKRVSLDIDTDLFKQLKLYCVANDENIYKVAEAALREYLKNK